MSEKDEALTCLFCSISRRITGTEGQVRRRNILQVHLQVETHTKKELRDGCSGAGRGRCGPWITGTRQFYFNQMPDTSSLFNKRPWTPERIVDSILNQCPLGVADPVYAKGSFKEAKCTRRNGGGRVDGRSTMALQKRG